MHKDDIFDIIKGDELIKYFGTVLLRKRGPRRKNDVAQRMRQLARLVNQLDDMDGIRLNERISDAGFDIVGRSRSAVI